MASALAEYIKTLREQRGLRSATQLAKAAGLDRSIVIDLEKVDRPNPKWQTLEKIAGALEIPVYYLAAALEGVGPENITPAERKKVDNRMAQAVISELETMFPDPIERTAQMENLADALKKARPPAAQ